MASRIQIATPDIIKAFEVMPPVLRGREVATTFNQNREFWRLAKSTSLASFISFMTDKTPLKEVRFPFPQREVTGFVWGELPLLEVLLGLVDKSFYSHYTAMRIHGLTEQVPKTIFFNHERSGPLGGDNDAPYEQEAIDSAFARPPRASKNEIEVGDQRIVFLQSSNQKSLGIVSGEVNFGGKRSLQLRYTNLERTLIDIAVRPFYAGGVFEVAKAFENAKDLKISVNTMASMFTRMEFGYPYHQAIGYYLERAGFNPSRVGLFRKMPMERDFYLTHQMGKTRFIPAWRLHVPEGF
ncbi:MAG: hypothetical protein EON54_24530 [Alcaligenaceae bacterium]|nr:MAG: hypothetical protein EON54_24530 [Alcaligenaceae bacterium]